MENLKLAYNVLASALAYQFGLEWKKQNPKHFNLFLLMKLLDKDQMKAQDIDYNYLKKYFSISIQLKKQINLNKKKFLLNMLWKF